MFAVLFRLLLLVVAASPALAQDRYRALYDEAEVYRAAIAAERPHARAMPATGITVPHHLVAVDLMARAFLALEGNSYERIIVVSPDHFYKSTRPMATTRRGFETVFGPVDVDTASVDTLAANRDLFDVSELFAAEHGVHALLPLVRTFFPGVPIVPVGVAIGSTPEQWRQAADALAQVMTPNTLIIQSTDFSHYLLPHVAAQRDQETINVISAGDPAAIARLHQSNHLDSKGSQTIQMLLQKQAGGHGVIIGNRNQAEYSPLVEKSTSYVVTLYVRRPEDASRLRYSDQQVAYFGGDFFPGRWLALPMANPVNVARVAGLVREATGGGDLVVNLEGVMMDEPPPGVPQDLHVFSTRPAADILKGMGVIAAGLANNHSHDLGTAGARHSRQTLSASGIRPLDHMKIADMGAYRLVALNYIGRNAHGDYPAVRGNDIEKLCRLKARPPLVAFVHWGEEYTTAAPAEAREQADQLHACGVKLIVGGHSHQPAPRPEAMWGGEFQMVYSLGNLLFDQRAPRGSGAILEVRLFRQGTFATRLIPIPNLFDLTRPQAGEARAVN